MKKAFTLAAAATLALGAAACHKAEDNSSANVASGDNMLVPADENSMGADNASLAADNGAGNNAMGSDNMMAPANSSNAM